MKETYIIDGIRTPIGNFAGVLSEVRADDLASIPITALLKRHPTLDPNYISEVILGCANQAGEDNRNIARMALLLAGLPYSVAGETVNRLCASGMSAAIHAHRSIQVGDGDLYIAGGVEHMTRGPWVISKTSRPFGQDAQMYDSSFGWRFINPKMKEMYGVDAMGATAENLADLYDINREDQDTFALWSQQKAAIAQLNGILAQEIVPIEISDKKGNKTIIEKDEFIKPNTNIELLSNLKPAFRKENGTVTAGNSSGLNDGACAILLGSQTSIDKFNFIPMAKIVSSAVVGVEPRIMGIGPVDASIKALAKANLTIDQIDVFEINEAFAVQSLAVMRNLGLKDNDPRVNINGGAIALGHPLGMSGARILLSASNELRRSNKKFALATMCVGVGMGYAVILESV